MKTKTVAKPYKAVKQRQQAGWTSLRSAAYGKLYVANAYKIIQPHLLFALPVQEISS